MNLLALTPDQATSNFNLWAAAVAGMVTTLCVTAAVVLPRLAALAAQVKTLFDLHGQNSAAITTLAINTPVPAAPAPPEAAALEANTAATQANTAAIAETPDSTPANPQT